MAMENIEVSVTLPRTLWEQMLLWAQTEQKNETILLVHAVERFLKQESAKSTFNKRLEQECEELAKMEFDDVGSEDEWLIIQNEALNHTEVSFG